MPTPVAVPAQKPIALVAKSDQRNGPAAVSCTTCRIATNNGAPTHATHKNHEASRWVSSRGSIRACRSSTDAATT